jgi:hypothetical protein
MTSAMAGLRGPCAAIAIAATLVLAGLPACRRGSAPDASSALDPALVAATNQAVGLMGRYDFAAAADLLASLAASHPRSAETAFNLAVALINRQRPEDAAEAERRLRPLLDHARLGVRAAYALGLLLLYQGRDGDALPLLTRAATAVPDDPYPAYFAGQAQLGEAPADAVTWFDKAAALDPRLRSAFYGAFQALQRLGRTADAQARLHDFQTLEGDPRARMAEFKYTRMGPMAEAVVIERAAPAAAAPAATPDGPLFLPPSVLHPRSGQRPAAPGSITVADIDGDGSIDVFVAGFAAAPAANLVLFQRAGAWQGDPDHPLARVPDVRAALWGDVDNDGRTDVVLLQPGTALLRRQPWASAKPEPLPGRADASDGALFDADHDGDLDIWLTVARGPHVLLNNDGNGSFRNIARQAGLAGDGRPSLGVAVADLDNDRDHDLVVLKTAPPHDVFLNDRVWRYRHAPGYDAFRAADASAVLAADLDADGRPELYTAGAAGLQQWSRAASGTLTARSLGPLDAPSARTASAAPPPPPTLALADVNGDGALELIVSTAPSWAAFDVPATGTVTRRFSGDATAAAWTVATLGDAHGPSVLALTDAGLVEWAPGPGRGAFVTLATTGQSQSSDQRRSNVSGVGTKIAVRTGLQWTALDTVRLASGRGQSLQPFAVGVGAAARTDFVTLTWSDGILQTELALDAGRRHVIEETQRQLSSCPVLFAFDGRTMRFVSDILGVGGIGFFERPGVYSAPFPQESFLLPADALAPDAGRLTLVVGEPMEEVAYFDRFELTAYDLPAGWQMALDERKAIASDAPTGRPMFYRHERVPVSARNDRGEDVTVRVTTADLQAAPPGPVDARFIGLTARHSVELVFDRPLDDGPGRPVLMADGWVEYPYAQTVFAAWQAGVAFEAPTLEARDGLGRWHRVAKEFGYPAGMPRRMTLPLDRLPPGTIALRLTTTQEIYWDRLAVIYEEPLPAAAVRPLRLSRATLSEGGFAQRSTGPQRTPFYDYARRQPLWDTRHPRGWYTRFGDVTPLVRDADDAMVVLGPGEEVAIEFDAPADALLAGWTRRYVLRGRGWCKDMDLYTEHGDTVEPLPGANTPARARLHAEFNTRYEGGR